MTDNSETVRAPSRKDYRSAVRHARAAVAKWQERGLVPPPHRCGYCGQMIGFPTLEGHGPALLGHLAQHEPAAEAQD